MAFLRQTATLTLKNLLIVFLRHPVATTIRALVLPILITAFLSFARNLFVPPAVNGIGTARGIKPLGDALRTAGDTGRNTVAFVDSGFHGGDIDRVIDALTAQVTAVGKTAVRVASEAELHTACKSSLRAVSPCYGAVVFRGSPTDTGGFWNYTIRLDGGLSGGRINVNRADNDGQTYMLPFQRAIDAAITGLNVTGDRRALPDNTEEYVFTELTQDERAERIRTNYQLMLINFLGVAFIAGMIGVAYHLTGFIATEREIGMSTLIESMMPTRFRWQPQAARLLSYHLSFSVIYVPGWVLGCLILQQGVFPHTSAAIVVFYHILAGLALASMSLAGAAFFKRSQLSGVTITITFILLAILAQSLTAPKTPAVAVLSLIFAPCNYVYFITYMARFEREKVTTNLTEMAPDSPWRLSGIVLWVFLIIQILVYPFIGAFIERYLYGTGTAGRTILQNKGEARGPDAAVQLEGFTKIYKPGFIRRMFSFISKPKDPVRAVDGLTLNAGRGQILALLGANGSGKSTTLDAIAGISKLTSGKITIDGTGGLGIAPQKNVLWDEVTVEEHIRIFNRLKSPGNRATTEEIRELVKSVDLAQKFKARSGTLSGGQKRKLQLGMMLTGGSAVCCVDEVSSGLDPLSRRKIWDILLAERGHRTMILTTHFLDEADLLADHIAVLSKGTLRAEGSSVELKDRLGGGYRIHILKTRTLTDGPEVEGVVKKVGFDIISYIAPSSNLAANVIRTLESNGIRDYRYSGPTIEDVFLQLAEEIHGENTGSEGNQSAAAETTPPSEDEVNREKGAGDGGLELLSGQRVGILRQIGVLFMKRCTVFKHNWFPYLAAFAIPIVAAGLTTLFVTDQNPPGCSPSDVGNVEIPENLFSTQNNLFFLSGPQAAFSSLPLLARLFGPALGRGGSPSGGQGPSSPEESVAVLMRNFSFVGSLDEFNQRIVAERKNVTPAGWWLGDSGTPPTLAYNSKVEILHAMYGQNLMNMMLTNTTLVTNFAPFDTPFLPETGDSLQLLVYMGLALSAFPGFFALYPTIERRRQVRGLQYSNGVREFPLWVAYLAFDFGIVVVSMAVAVALFAGLSQVWYHVEYLFVVFLFYGLTSVLLAYIVSLFARNQLSAYAFTAAGQAVSFLIYLIAYLVTVTYAPINRVDETLLIVHWVISIVAPMGSVVRAMFIALNLFYSTCDGEQVAPNPGAILVYGGPIAYLVVQSLLLFILLLWLDSGTIRSSWHRLLAVFRRPKPAPGLPSDVSDEEIAGELVRVTSRPSASGSAARRNASTEGPANRGGVVTAAEQDDDRDGLQVVHVTKSFGKNTAVNNVTFGIKRGEVFALLGPNGAGKSTTISMVRGDIQPDPRTGGDIFVEGVSVTKRLAAARAHLGVCPQFDAVDQMTVLEHLRFYARVRGIPDVDHNVEAVVRAVGLGAFRHRQAHALSGGNKRKLSLGIALMGNPSVLLLDEPSSGLDAAAKRVMWRTLAATVPGRSILLTTHSMEEADALAGRAGILARRMLAMGTADNLRARFGDKLHVHLVCKGAPRTSDEDAARLRDWVVATFPGAEVEEKMYHGQMRFSVPAAEVLGEKEPGQQAAARTESRVVNHNDDGVSDLEDDDDDDGPTPARRDGHASSSAASQSAIGKLVVLLEEQKQPLGIEHFSVSSTTLDQVFLNIVGRHNVKEEGYHEEKPKPWYIKLLTWK